jgi:hypothetical protein
MLDPIAPLIIVLIPSANPVSLDPRGQPETAAPTTLQQLHVDEEMLDAALVRRGIDLKTANPTFEIHSENSPLNLRGFNGRVITVSLDEITRAQPNWAVERGR